MQNNTNSPVLNAVSEIGEVVKMRLERQDSEIKSLNQAVTDLAQMRDGYTSMPGNRGTGFGQVKTAIEQSAAVRAIQAGEAKSGIVKLDGIGIKSLFDSFSGGADTQAQRSPVLGEMLQVRADILTALPTLAVTSNQFEFLQLNGYTNAVDYQATEGGTKPESTVPTKLVTVPIETLATWLPISTQAMQDNDSLMLQIRQLLMNSLRRKVITELIAGAASTGIQGLATEGSSFVATAGTKPADAVGQAIASLNGNGWSASHVLLNPADWQGIQAERATGGEYVAAGWASVAQSVWGVPVITDAAVPVGSPIVLDNSQVAVLDRMQPRIEFGVINDQFTRNVRSALIETRIGLAVFSPTAVLNVSIAT